MKNQFQKIGLLLLSILFISQYAMAQKDYESKWESVAKLEEEAKTKDALAAVENILQTARKEKNNTQAVKALLHKYKYMMTLEEDAELKIANGIKNEIQQAQGTEKAILQSILAELYYQYFQENTWKFSKRTETDTKQSDDFRTWDLKTLFKEINAYYISSLEQKTLLQQTKLDAYTPILTNQKRSTDYRPTLYELLAHRAIDYFNDTKSNLAEPENAFTIDQEAYFSSATDFCKLQLQHIDTNSQSYNALLIFQDLLRLRLEDKQNKDALADVDLKRIQFIREHYYNKEKNEALYYDALLRMQKEYANCDFGATINYQIANFIVQKNQNKNKNGNFDYEKKTNQDAIDLIDNTIKNYPNTEGAINCKALKLQVLNKSIKMTTEEAVAPQQAFKGLITYKNIPNVYLKIISIDYKQHDKIFSLKKDETNADILKRLNAIKPIKSWNITLPKTDDYLEHKTEINLPALSAGYYILMTSTDEKFSISTGNNAVAVNHFFVTQISYVTKTYDNSNDFEMYVLNRNTGQPLSNATVKFFQEEYDYNKRKYISNEIGTATSDKDGFVKYSIFKGNTSQYYNNRNFKFDIYYKNEYLPSQRAYYKYYNYYNETETPNNIVHLFTDRSIYRPGQTIYFKGIAIQRYKNEEKILTNTSVDVNFRDVNDQIIATQSFTTNEFGSFSGTFTAPSTGLLGSMTLETNYGSVSVQVEEYKRPKFEVTFEPIKKSYNLNDTITVTGKSISYSGANINDAEVKYTVRRVVNFPIWCWWGWRRPWYPQQNEKIITFGTTKTDDNGNFTVQFSALPDLTVSKEFKPYFNYEITADVVDINGETHGATTSVRVGYLAIDANVNMNEKLNKDVQNTINITTNNLNGQKEPTDVSIKIYKLKDLAYPKKERLWDEPDKFLLSKIEHDKLFPYEVYDDEDLMTNWEKEKLVNQYNFNTGKQNEITLAANSLPSGAYILEFSCKDKNGKPIEFKKTFTTYSLSDKQPATKRFAYFNIDKTSVKVGDTARIQVGSSMQNAFAIVEVSYNGEIFESKKITINQEIKTISIPIKEKYIGGIEVNYVLVNNNRTYSNKSFINVPYKSKQLNVEWLTFRDKLLPGAKEQWKLKISGPDKEKVSAELLATMYDASLDAFLPHAYSFGVYQPIFSGYLNAYGKDAFGIKTSSLYSSKSWNPYVSFISHYYNNLNLFDLRIGRRYYNRYFYDGAPGSMMQMKSLSVKGSTAAEEIAESMPIEADKKTKAEPSPAPSPIAKDTITKSTPNEVVPRKNLQETAFFFPQLQTDEEGNIILNFQMPEALTRWKFLGLAHTKNLESAVFSKTVVTQKELMVTPNAPRFLREGDVLDLSSKISNLSDRLLSGTAAITIYDAATMKDITAQFIEANRETKTFTRNFTVDSKKNTAVSWTLTIPQDVDAIVYKIVATAENFSDGEQAPLIILPNRMMVTETLPMWVNGKSKKTYKFEKLLNNKSKTLKNYNLTLEMSSQPVWYAVQALPYMMEYPYECAEQLFSRYYANTLASYIANKNPKLKTIFEQWKNTDALLSNLEKNQELKSVLLEETPWVRDAQNETEQKKRIALLFDLNKMNYEQERALQKLLQMQTPNGGFAWFPGMPDNRFITQYIVAGLGHLSKLNVIDIDKEPRIKEMLQKAVQYLDDRLREDLEQIKIYDKDYLKKDHLWYSNIQALYARSFFDFKMGKQNEDAYNYFIEQEKKFWTDQQSLYAKSMIALTLNRKNEKQIANKIIYSFKQNAINSEELGMYWKANENAGWYWYQAPVETQAMLIEAFHEVAQDEKSVDEMKVWLLKQKQTTAWKSTKATAEACYALLLQGSDWIASDKLVKVEMNGKTINPKEYDAIIEPGTGYYKINWKGDDIKQEMGKIELQKCDKGPAYGALYWQYFEDLDKITGANTSLQLSKKLFKEENTSSGKKLISITESTPLKVGDVVKVRIELRTDRNLEYVHLKDMRAAGFEPVNVLSQYKYQDGLGYYESTKDVATHFFIDWMNKGIYVFEYAMRATIAGNFSNGITLIESMYAPEFKAHSKGERVNIVNNK